MNLIPKSLIVAVIGVLVATLVNDFDRWEKRSKMLISGMSELAIKFKGQSHQDLLLLEIQ